MPRPRGRAAASWRPEVGRDGAQGAMEEDADRALAAAEDVADLGGAHLLDEAERHRAAAVVGEAVHRGPGGPGLVAQLGLVGDVEGVGEARGELDRRGGPAAQGPAMVGDDVARDAEEPDPEGRGVRRIGEGVGGSVADGRRPAPALLEAREPAEREHEGPLRHVLRLMVVAQLVQRERVDLRHVLPIQGLEPGGVPPRLLDEAAVGIEPRDGVASGPESPSTHSEHRTRHGVTPPPRDGRSRRRGPAARRLPPRGPPRRARR